MSATTTTNKSSVQSQTPSNLSFTDWQPSGEKEPTEEQERKARKRTLEMGNETEIHYPKAPDGQEDYYERLDLHNRDCYWKFRDEVDVSRDCDNQYKSHVLHSLAGELGLSRFQREKAMRRLFELNLPRFGMRTDVIAFCLCGIILKEEANERYGDDAPYNPHRASENNPDSFVRIESRLIEADGPTTKKYIQKVWGKLQYGVPPTRSDADWKPFVQSESRVQPHPSYQPDHTKS